MSGLSLYTVAPRLFFGGVDLGMRLIDLGMRPVGLGMIPVNLGMRPVNLGMRLVDLVGLGVRPVSVLLIFHYMASSAGS